MCMSNTVNCFRKAILTNIGHQCRLVVGSEDAVSRDTGSFMQGLLMKVSDIIVKAKVS